MSYLFKNPNFIVPDAVTANVGSLTGTVSDVQTMLDGNILTINEVAGTPGQDTDFDFSNVEVLFGLVTRFYYTGTTTTHYVKVSLRNWGGASDDEFIFVSNANTGQDHNIRTILFPEAVGANYINTGGSLGDVQMAFIHAANGNASHDTLVDYVGLLGRAF